MINTIRCADIPYRQGLIEVVAGVHAHHVNLEVWNIAPDRSVPEHPRGPSFADPGVITGSTEIELSRVQAEALIKALQDALQLLPA